MVTRCRTLVRGVASDKGAYGLVALAPWRDAPRRWAFFESEAPSYRRAATWYVISAKRQQTRLKRLATLIDDSAHQRRLAGMIPTKRSAR